MEVTVGMLLKMFAIANGGVVLLLLWWMVAPLAIQTTFAITLGDLRYGYGSHGWTVQRTPHGHVLAQGWFPWGPPRADVNPQ